jgi:hypothetical protein
VPSLNLSQILVWSSKENKEEYTLQKLCWGNSEYENQTGN